MAAKTENKSQNKYSKHKNRVIRKQTVFCTTRIARATVYKHDKDILELEWQWQLVTTHRPQTA